MSRSIHGEWSSRLIFILAAVGSAVGLGNIWKFPYITGEYGGGVFVFVYLICVATIGLPVMIAEITLGRRGRESPVNTMASLARAAGGHRAWALLGWGGMLAGFLILSYYSVIAGEVLAYVFRAGSGAFVNQSADGVHSILTRLESEPERLLAWHTIFMAMTMIVVARGVRGGLEQAVRFLMPALIVLLLILVGYAMNSGGFEKAVQFMFHADFDKFLFARDKAGEFLVDGNGSKIFTWKPMLVALGHAFFTLSLGMGAIMMYGSYLNRNASIGQMTLIVVVMDTLVALLAGLAIFPLVFAHGLNPASGPGLIFETLPLAFGTMSGGTLIGTLFFLLLLIAAWTSAISLVEPAVAWLVENRNVSRVYASMYCGIIIWLIGLATIFSLSGTTMRDVVRGLLSILGLDGLELKAQFFNLSLFQAIDFLTASIMLPLGGFFIAIFAGWIMERESTQHELGFRQTFYYEAWLTMVRYISPILILFVFLYTTGIIRF